MEEVLLRFRHLGQDIFESLNDEDFAKSRKVGRKWKIFIDNCNNKFFYLRIIKSFYKKPKQSFEIALKNSTKDEVKSMATTIQTFCKIWMLPKSELHKAALKGKTQIFEEIFDNSEIEVSEPEGKRKRKEGSDATPLALGTIQILRK